MCWGGFLHSGFLERGRWKPGEVSGDIPSGDRILKSFITPPHQYLYSKYIQPVESLVTHFVPAPGLAAP
jgi:hypothetical protein